LADINERRHVDESRSRASDENLEIDIFLLPHGASRCVEEATAKNGARAELQQMRKV
jgi:hypothetical protein